MSPKRALFVTTVPVTLTSFLLPLANALRDSGWRVDCLTSASSGPGWTTTSSDPALRASFDECHEIGWSRSPMSVLGYRSLAKRVRAVVSQGEYDVVHVHTPIASFVTRAALRKQRISHPGHPRVIYTVHGFHFYPGGQGKLASRAYRVAERLAASWTDHLVVMNDYDEEAARALCAPPCRVQRIDGTGLDFGQFDRSAAESTGLNGQTRRRFGISEDDFVVTFVGEMNANKRQSLAIEAAALLRDELPGLRLLLVGDGPLRPELETLTAARGLDRIVSFVGQIPSDDVRSLGYVTDVGLLVSAREGLPRSLMELVAAGATIAGTRTRGIIDEVVDERALAPSADPEGVAAVIRRLADSDLRIELGRKQLEHARSRYSLEVTLDRYMVLYEMDLTA